MLWLQSETLQVCQFWSNPILCTLFSLGRNDFARQTSNSCWALPGSRFQLFASHLPPDLFWFFDTKVRKEGKETRSRAKKGYQRSRNPRLQGLQNWSGRPKGSHRFQIVQRERSVNQDDGLHHWEHVQVHVILALPCFKSLGMYVCKTM